MLQNVCSIHFTVANALSQSTPSTRLLSKLTSLARPLAAAQVIILSLGLVGKKAVASFSWKFQFQFDSPRRLATDQDELWKEIAKPLVITDLSTRHEDMLSSLVEMSVPFRSSKTFGDISRWTLSRNVPLVHHSSSLTCPLVHHSSWGHFIFTRESHYVMLREGSSDIDTYMHD